MSHETPITFNISNEASTLNVLFGLQQTFCKRAGKSRQLAPVAQRCNLALQPNLELIQRQTKVINPKYYKRLKKGAHQSQLGRQKMGWFLAD